MLSGFGRPHFSFADLFPAFLIVLVAAMLIEAWGWSFGAQIVPLTVGTMALCFVGVSLANQVFRAPEPEPARAGETKAEIQQKIHMDIAADTADIPTNVILRRAAIFFGWLVAFMVSMAVVGLIPTIPLFVIAYMRVENTEPWKLVLPQAVGLTLFVYVIFDRLLAIPWPQTLLGALIPALRIIPSV